MSIMARWLLGIRTRSGAGDRARGAWPGHRRPVVVIFLLGCMLACFRATAQADNPAGFRRNVWTIESGAPADIWALAQGKDGYLWMGTGNGLYRFDGVRFERFEPPAGEQFRSNDITALTMLPDDSLWIGFYYGGASVMRGGHVRHYAPGNSFPNGTVLTFAQTADGTVWAATDGGLARFDGQRWHTVGADWNYPPGRADWLIVSDDGTLWVTTGETLVFLRRGAHRFEATGIPVYKDGIVAQAPDGTLWLSEHQHGTRALPGLTATHPYLDQAPVQPKSDASWSYRLLFDRYGNLWGTGVDKGGVYRVASLQRFHQGQPLQPSDFTEKIDRTNGLMTNRAVPLLQDAEGTIWAGTNLGLASFHRNNVVVPSGVPLGTAANYAMAMDANGTVWVLNDGTLLRMTDAGAEVVRRDLHDISGAQFSRDGTLWMVGRNLLFALHGDTIDSTSVPQGTSKVNALTLDRAGDPWLALAGHGLYRLHNKQWLSVSPDASLDGSTPTALATDAAGHLWIGYPDNRVVDFDGHVARLYTAVDGLRVGNVTAINASGKDVLIGGELGLARLHDSHIQSLVIPGSDVFNGITGMAQTANGDLWLNTGKGVVRLAANEAEATFRQPGYRPAFRLFDYRDGLPGIAVQAAKVPTALIDPKQRIWFLTSQGPAWIAPNDLHSNVLPPPVSILGLSANGTHYVPAKALRLPKGTDNLQLEYTATSLAVPGRVTFRYRLDGVDSDWQNPGTRREAFYSNLAPGTYRFHVIAANDDGVWNNQGAEFRFTIAPWFYQTLWFYALCALALLALVVMFFAWRMRLAAERVHLRLTERMNERERIARDIHDTLLQGVQGLLLRLQAMLAGMAPDDKRTYVLKAAVEQARQMVIEGRGKIISLRGDGPQYTELVQSLLAVGENLASLYPTTFHITTEGKPRALLPSAFDEILDIVREGIRNAFIHAQAMRVDVHVAYETRALRIVVCDDGGGIDDATLRAAAELGHWGVVGMRERAERLSAQLVLHRRQPHGTEVLLSVPCRAAYRPDKPDSRRHTPPITQ
jgi:signal transduction histidine kinase/ligand-binding sensor domain-containing protein